MPLTTRKATIAAARQLHERGLWLLWILDGQQCCIPQWQDVRLTLTEVESVILGFRNVGIGVVWSRSPYVDLDCDDPDADRNLELLCGGSLPRTPTFRSRRGLHRIFQRPTDMPDKARHPLEGIGDLLGLTPSLGAYSVVPPSNKRRWLPGLSLDDLEPTQLPEPIAERVRREAAEQKLRKRSVKEGSEINPPLAHGGVQGVHTFFQYVMASVFGPPLISRVDGYALWLCPWCGQETLHSRPTHPIYKDRFQCWRCDWHGDAADVLAFADPQRFGSGMYGHAMLHLSALRQQFQRFLENGLYDLNSTR